MENTDLDQDRFEQLSEVIESIFGEGERTFDGSRSYDEIMTEMFEVIDVKPRGVLLMHLFEDIEYPQVAFPEKVRPLLKRHDAFLITLGRNQRKWHVLNMSPPYVSEFIDYGHGHGDDDEDGESF